MIDRSIDSLTVKSIVRVIWFHFVSSQYIRIILYKVSQFLENVFLLNKNRQHVSENRDEPVRIMAASFGRKTMLLPQVFWAVLKRFILEIDRKYAENMWYPRPRLGRPNSFSGQSLGMNFVAQTNVWSHLVTVRPAVSSTAHSLTHSSIHSLTLSLSPKRSRTVDNII